TLVLGGQRVVVAGLGGHQLVADVAGTLPEERVDLAPVQRFVEVGGDGELRACGYEKLASTQIRHPDPPCQSKDGTKPGLGSAPGRPKPGQVRSGRAKDTLIGGQGKCRRRRGPQKPRSPAGRPKRT